MWWSGCNDLSAVSSAVVFGGAEGDGGGDDADGDVDDSDGRMVEDIMTVMVNKCGCSCAVCCMRLMVDLT